MSELPGNSHNSRNQRLNPEAGKDEKPEVEKIVKGSVKQRKKPLWRRTKELFFGGESEGVLHHVFVQVMIPAAQDLVADAAESAIRGAVYGQPNGGPPSRRRRGGGPSYSYSGKQDYNNRFRDPRSREVSSRARTTHDMGEFVLESRVEGEEILDNMYALLDRYDQVTVYDLYGMLGKSAHYTDQKWGWTSLRGSTIRRERDGYILDLPRTEPLN